MAMVEVMAMGEEEVLVAMVEVVAMGEEEEEVVAMGEEVVRWFEQICVGGMSTNM